MKRATTQGDYGLHRVKKVDPTGQVFSTFTTGSYPIYWSGSLNNSVFPPAYVTPKKNEENNKPHNRLPQHCNDILYVKLYIRNHEFFVKRLIKPFSFMV